MAKIKEIEESEEGKDKSKSIIIEQMRQKDTNFNHLDHEEYFTSTGSLNLDLEMGGGIKNSIIRISGEAETGKTSFSFKVIKNFLETKGKRRRAVYFLSDRNLSKEIEQRSGIKFTKDAEEFEDGVCFIYMTNVYEAVCNTIRKFTKTKTNDIEYMFVLDCIDNFAPQAALDSEFGESSQKGGTTAITSHFFRCFGELLPLLGHTTIFISQYRDIFNMGKGKPIHKQMSTSGGRAQEHGVSWALEFQPALNSKEDMFWEGEPYKSKKIGHNCIIVFKKTTNEKTNVEVKYPILYRRANGNSVWTEKELLDQLLFFQMIKRKTSWLQWESSILSEIKAINPETPNPIQGEETFVTFLEKNPKITDFLYKKMISLRTSL